MESKEDLWMDMYAPTSIRHGPFAASVLENQGSGHFDGSRPSSSSSSSERNSTDLIDGSAEASEDGEVHAMLQDAEVRAMLRKVTINEGVWNMAVQSLGGGEKGLKSLMGYILVWVKQHRDIQSSSQQPPPPPPPNPAWNFSTVQDVVLQPSFDAFQILSSILQHPPTTQLLDQEVRYTRRLKSRKLMSGKPEMGAGLGGVDIEQFYSSNFISSPEDYNPDVTSPDMMAPCSPQQQQPVTPFTHIAMPSAEPTPATTTKAARSHRMTRQRQSFHARAASPVATDPVSVGSGSLWNPNAAAPPAVATSGLSGTQTPPQRTPVAAARVVRNERQPKF